MCVLQLCVCSISCATACACPASCLTSRLLLCILTDRNLSHLVFLVYPSLAPHLTSSHAQTETLTPADFFAVVGKVRGSDGA